MGAKLTPNRLAILKKIVEVGSAVHWSGTGSGTGGDRIGNTRITSGTLFALEKAGLLAAVTRAASEDRG